MAGFTDKDGRCISTYDINYGRIAVTGVRAALPIQCEYVKIKASNNNGGRIFVGGAAVDGDNGYELAAGEELTMGLGLGNLMAASSIWFISDGADGDVYYIAYN